MSGINPYQKPQDSSSRRFYYSSDTCISSIHLMPRDDVLRCNAVFRSTNVQDNSSIDIEFLVFLIKTLGAKYFFNCKTYNLNLRINSGHII